jgi:trimethylamine--corrinoid protein Co-methyltransferase
MPDQDARRSRRRDRNNNPNRTEERPVSQFGGLRNHLGYLTPLNEDHIEQIHQNSMNILREFGIKVLSQEARGHLKSLGCLVDDDSMMVRVDEDFVMTHLATAPAEFTLTPRNSSRRITLGGNHVNFGMVSGPPNVSDRDRGRRPSQYQDFKDLICLGQSLHHIHCYGNQTAATNDLNVHTRHLDSMLTTLTCSDKVSSCMSVGRERVTDAVNMVAIARGITLDEMASSPGAMTNINVNSPRVLDVEMSDAAFAMAEMGQAVIVTPFTLMGAMAPVSLPAALAQQNAEALFVIALIQSWRPGTPVVYGGFTSNVDMKTGAPAFGTPENTLTNLATGQLCRRYRLPYRSSGCSASNVPDAQAAYETQMSLWGAIFGGANLIYHAAGWMEGGLVASYEKVMLDGDMLEGFAKMLTPIDFSPAEFAMDAIGEVDPGGHFFGHQHTLERYKSAFFAPMLSDWQNFENWQANGSLTAYDRAEAKWRTVLKDFTPPDIDPAIDQALSDYVARRKTEIGNRPL